MGAETRSNPGDLSPSPIGLAPIMRLLLSPNEAAAALRISSRLLWSRTKSNDIPCVRIGKLVRYCPRALQDWIDRTTRTA